jgi:hypothetical protein
VLRAIPVHASRNIWIGRAHLENMNSVRESQHRKGPPACHHCESQNDFCEMNQDFAEAHLRRL